MSSAKPQAGLTLVELLPPIIQLGCGIFGALQLGASRGISGYVAGFVIGAAAPVVLVMSIIGMVLATDTVLEHFSRIDHGRRNESPD